MDASNKKVVLLGKTGSGKSSLANIICEETLFNVNHTSKSETRKCQAETRSVNGRNISLIDTPGFFDTDISEKELKPEIIKCITESTPGVHAFLILLKVEKNTEHEKDVIMKIKEYFSDEFFKYATVVFTHGDQLQEGQTIEQFVHEDEDLRELVKKCGGRCHVIDNKYWKEKPMDEYRSNKFQVEQLLKTIDKMIEENKGGYYTNEMLQAVEEKIQRQMKAIKQSSGSMSDEEAREQAKKNVWAELLTALKNVAEDILLKAYFGVTTVVRIVSRIMSTSATFISDAVGAVVGAVEGAVVGAVGAVVGAVGAVTGAVGAVAGAVIGWFR